MTRRTCDWCGGLEHWGLCLEQLENANARLLAENARLLVENERLRLERPVHVSWDPIAFDDWPPAWTGMEK